MARDLYDFHSHILPGMDDGYDCAESAIEALKISYDQGVRHMVATPHYYSDESVDSFLERRQRAMDTLQAAMDKDGGPFPEICLGAEVAYYPNICFSEELQKLCIGKSNYLLLEPPFRMWGIEVLRDVQSICNAGEIVPILAHIERYIPIQNKRIAQQMLALELRLQMNAEFILERKTRRFAKRMLKENPAFLLGSDCHNLTDRTPQLGQALDTLRGGTMEHALRQAMELSEEIWEQAAR